MSDIHVAFVEVPFCVRIINRKKKFPNKKQSDSNQASKKGKEKRIKSNITQGAIMFSQLHYNLIRKENLFSTYALLSEISCRQKTSRWNILSLSLLITSSQYNLRLSYWNTAQETETTGSSKYISTFMFMSLKTTNLLQLFTTVNTLKSLV
jgi:hypothetical protein